jgi:hypothetical protein
VWYPSSTSNGTRHRRWLGFNAERGHSRWHNPNPNIASAKVSITVQAKSTDADIIFGRLIANLLESLLLIRTKLHHLYSSGVLAAALQPNIAIHVDLRDAGCVRSRLKYKRMDHSNKMTRSQTLAVGSALIGASNSATSTSAACSATRGSASQKAN